MECVSNMIRVSLPNYFSNLPVPNSIGGWFSLSVGDWMRLIPFGAAVGGLSYLSMKGLASTPVVGPYIQNTMSKVPGFQPARINNSIKLDSPKVVDTVEIEDIGDKAVFCRCWKSKKFPYCDGSHAKHNELTGDNVAPLIVKKSS